MSKGTIDLGFNQDKIKVGYIGTNYINVWP